MLVNFSGPSCGPCEKLKRETLADEAVLEMLGEQFEAAQVDASLEPEIATRYLVNQFPVVKVLEAGGEVVYDHRGFVEAADFLGVMERALEAHATVLRARALAEEAGDAASPEQSMQIAQDFFSVGWYETSAGWARRALEAMPADDAQSRATASFVLGVSLAESGEPRAAVEPLEEALSLAPEAPWVWQARLNLGYAFLQVDDREQGGALLRQVAASEEADTEFRREARLLLRWVGLDLP